MGQPERPFVAVRSAGLFLAIAALAACGDGGGDGITDPDGGTQADSVNFTWATTGAGYGRITPAEGRYAKGTDVVIGPDADDFYQFHSVEAGPCAGTQAPVLSESWNGCRVTFEDEDVHSVMRFEPIRFVADVSMDYTVTSSTCTWNNSLQNMTATVSYSRSGGVDYGHVRVQGTRVYTSSQSGCTSATATIDIQEDFEAQGSGMDITLVLGQGSTSQETLTLTAADFRRDVNTFGSLRYEFTGSDRSGSAEHAIVPWQPVAQSQ